MQIVGGRELEFPRGINKVYINLYLTGNLKKILPENLFVWFLFAFLHYSHVCVKHQVVITVMVTTVSSYQTQS